ncbi:NINE protein [Phaeodactylibacter luteus]|uniref:NINE protein n=1 Tax=Phaeodactylibacter luteus TaxID=1564516 RepID=A0A5C6RMI1_9BACT|nr:NINE protein [Phaeodactylibacter luteus]TXB62850.1 NINE protein [Phaeodactylibacter luteus]
MKEKNVAGILALFLGGLGIHRFYLGQTGLGIFYLLFFWFPVMWIVGLIDAIVFFSMDGEAFDRKYNREALFRQGREAQRQYKEEYRDYRESRKRKGKAYYRPANPAPNARPSAPRRPVRKPENVHKNTGVAKFKEYDYAGAIQDFKKALKVEPNDIATHFNLACAYSVTEQTELSLRHLDLAVSLGFDDFDRIREHDKLAFLRIQDEYEAFEKNGFRLEDSPARTPSPQATAEPVEDHSHILEQLKQLAELKEKGLLTEDEFALQKKRLLG